MYAHAGLVSLKMEDGEEREKQEPGLLDISILESVKVDFDFQEYSRHFCLVEHAIPLCQVSHRSKDAI